MPNLRSSVSSPILKTPTSTSPSQVSKTPSASVETPVSKTASTTLSKPTKKPVLATEQEPETLHQAIEQTPSTDMQERASKIPSIEALQQAKGNLKTPENIRDTSQGVADFAKKEVMNDVTTSKSGNVESKAVERIHETLSDRALANKLKSLESETLIRARSTFAVSLQNGRRNLDSQINQGLSHVIAPYEKKTKSLIGSATSKSAETELGQQVKSWVQDQGKNSDVVLSIQNMSASEVDQMAAGLLKDLKGYSDKDMQKLSDRKQAFIRVVSENLQEGAKTAGDNTKGSQSIRNNMNEIKQEYAAVVKNEGGMKSQLGRELMLRSDESVLSAVHDDVSQTNNLLKKAVLAGINEGLGGSVSSTQVAPQGKNIGVPEQISINGKTYGTPKYLASGGFAHIVAYTNVNNAEDRIVLKQLKDDGEKTSLELRAEATEEILGQIEIEGQNGHPNINPLVGTIRGENEQIYIIQDMAKGGALSDVKSALWTLQENNVLPEDVRQLLGTHLMKGTLQGMDHIQNERQGHHFDLKLPNVLLGSDGQAKITDFGFSGLGNTRLRSQLEGNESADYQSPDMIHNLTEKSVIDAKLREQGVETFALSPNELYKGVARAPIAPKIPDNLTEMSLDEQANYQTALNDHEEAMVQHGKKQAYLDRYLQGKSEGLFTDNATSNKADNWNAGIMAHDLMKGKVYDTELFSFGGVKTKVAKFGEDEDNRMATASRVGGENGEMGMGITAVDKLINGLMHVDPEKRTNFKETLKNSVFKDERLDKPEVGQLLLKISQVDPKNLSAQDSSEIQQLVNALKA